MKKILFLLTIIMLFTSCAEVQDVSVCVKEHVYGFWGGLWHGMIFLFSFIGSIFNDDIAIYAVNNNGGWYDFGFFLGIGSFGTSASKASN